MDRTRTSPASASGPAPHLIHLADYGGPHAGSFVPMLCTLAAVARQRGSALEAVLPTRAQGRPWLVELEQAHVPVTFLDPAPVRRAVPAIRKMLGGGREVILHTHFTGYDIAAVLAAGGKPDAHVIWHVHTSFPSQGWGRLRSGLKHRVLGRRVATVLCVAEHIAEEVRSRGSSRTRFLPNGIPIERFMPRDRDERQQARAELGLPTDNPVVLHFGRDWEIKGGDLFLRAVERLRDQGRPVHAIVLRGGEPQRALAAELGIEDVVRGIEGVKDIRDLYVVADVFVSASRHEGMPFTLLEALACGVPVAATRIPGHLAVAARCPGIELMDLNADAIAAALVTVLDREPAQTAAELAAALAWIKANATLESWAESLLQVYAGVLPPKASSG